MDDLIKTGLFTKPTMQLMPTQESFRARLRRIGIIDEDGNIDMDRLNELENCDLPISSLG